ncbi:hypothetical protein ACNKHN_17555 [Shigella flexneri]
MLWPIRQPRISRRTAGRAPSGRLLAFPGTFRRSRYIVWKEASVAPMLEDNHGISVCRAAGFRRSSRLISVTGIRTCELLGESIDDAAGEAFDETAKLLGLDYRAGPFARKIAARVLPGALSSAPDDRPSGAGFQLSGRKTRGGKYHT